MSLIVTASSKYEPAYAGRTQIASSRKEAQLGGDWDVFSRKEPEFLLIVITGDTEFAINW